ncbi:5' nucleotidase, NT5C type [Aneurinibacillus terranovensis]|uniref:5' nucleotidase, NT5C type n=1 Tax=Aneurinibacillus terranovensis TaxID=278991 RepID=UPI00042162CC|nr:HAD family acid phosphatase [Aneurinibacillus terranovensis]
MKIGFDIDDTLNDIRYTITRIFNEHLEREVTNEFVDTFPTLHVYDAFNLSHEEGHNLWRKFQDRIHEENLPLEFSSDALNKLTRDGHEIYYITAREDSARDATVSWLKKYKFPFQEDHLFIGMKDEEKAGIAKEIGLDLFFDDKPHVLDAFAGTGVKVCIKDTCYNQHAPYQRISSWSELEKIVQGHVKSGK